MLFLTGKALKNFLGKKPSEEQFRPCKLICSPARIRMEQRDSTAVAHRQSELFSSERKRAEACFAVIVGF